MPQALREAGCACGRVRMRTRGEPKRVAICHCLTCRKAHGAPFVVFAIFADADVEITGDVAGWHASEGYERCFCRACGSRVFGRDGGECEVSVGAFDEPGVFVPQYEAWASRREPWLPAFGLALHEGDRPRP